MSYSFNLYYILFKMFSNWSPIELYESHKTKYNLNIKACWHFNFISHVRKLVKDPKIYNDQSKI